MKPLSILSLILIVILLVSCQAFPVGEPEPTSEPATEAVVEEAPADTPTPLPTETPLPTDTPAPTDTPPLTDTPVPTPPPPEPTATPLPPEPTPEPEEPTETPTSQPLPAPVLMEPQEAATLAGPNAVMTFKWSDAARPLAENEYYVLIITHREGKDFIWTKESTYTSGEDKVWWAQFGPALQAQVVIASQRTGEPNEDPTGAELSPYSLPVNWFWNL